MGCLPGGKRAGPAGIRTCSEDGYQEYGGVGATQSQKGKVGDERGSIGEGLSSGDSVVGNRKEESRTNRISGGRRLPYKIYF